jgi:hypothetical protein
MEESDLVTMEGEGVARVFVATPPDTPPIRELLSQAGIACYEADIPFATRYLIDRGLRGAARIEGGRARRGRLIGWIYEDPEVAPVEWTPELSVLSIDIETDPKATRLLSAGLYAEEVAEVHVVHAGGPGLPEAARAYPDEASLLRGVIARVRAIDPDVLVGWNLIDFDLSVIGARCRALSIDFFLGRPTPCSVASSDLLGIVARRCLTRRPRRRGAPAGGVRPAGGLPARHGGARCPRGREDLLRARPGRLDRGSARPGHRQIRGVQPRRRPAGLPDHREARADPARDPP